MMPASSHETRKARTSAPAADDGSVRDWSGPATRQNDALELEDHLFEAAHPARIASSLKASAEQSTRRKAEPFRSAMSMLTFYINRAGSNLSKERRAILEDAKNELRAQFGRAPRTDRSKRQGHAK